MASTIKASIVLLSRADQRAMITFLRYGDPSRDNYWQPEISPLISSLRGSDAAGH